MTKWSRIYATNVQQGREKLSRYLEEMIENVPSWVEEKLRKISNTDEQLTYVLETFIERAGIMEFDGKQSRFEAEEKALKCIIEEHLEY